MEKGFFDECDLTDPGTICFWIFLPISVVVWAIDAIF
jgi:hypothetical protein